MKENLKKQLLDLCLGYTSRVGANETGINRLQVMHRVQKGEKRSFNEAYLALVLQGRKKTLLGNQEYVYGSGDCVVTCLDLPSQTIIEEASPEKPFISAVITIDRNLLNSLCAQSLGRNLPEQPAVPNVSAMAVAPCSDEMAENFLRLLELGRKSKLEIALLQDTLLKEIHTRLLLSKQGAWVRAVCALEKRSGQIQKAVSIIKERFKETLAIEELASEVNLSEASFHRHFKQLTGYSAIQFQKFLKLYEARRLLLVGGKSVSAVAFELGYASPSQFTHDYKSFFKATPLQDLNFNSQ